jgi:hypothetical protein
VSPIAKRRLLLTRSRLLRIIRKQQYRKNGEMCGKPLDVSPLLWLRAYNSANF